MNTSPDSPMLRAYVARLPLGSSANNLLLGRLCRRGTDGSREDSKSTAAGERKELMLKRSSRVDLLDYFPSTNNIRFSAACCFAVASSGLMLDFEVVFWVIGVSSGVVRMVYR